MVFGRSHSLSRATLLSVAKRSAAAPSTAKAAMTPGFAPHARRSSSVPRTAEPALMTSFTIATRRLGYPLPQHPRHAVPAGNSAPESLERCGCEQVNGSLMDREVGAGRVGQGTTREPRGAPHSRMSDAAAVQ